MGLKDSSKLGSKDSKLRPKDTKLKLASLRLDTSRRCVSTPHFYLEFGVWKAASLLLLLLDGVVQRPLLILN